MKHLLRTLFSRARVIVFFIWTYALIELLQAGRYLTFLRPEFGYVLGGALIMFITLVFAEMARDPDDGLHWYEMQRPLILMLPLLFLLNAQGASLDYYTFNKRFTGTAGMAVNVEPSRNDSRVPEGSDNGEEIRSSNDVPSSLNPSGRDRIRFNRRWNPDGTEAADQTTGEPSAPAEPEAHTPGTLPESERPKGDNDDELDDGSTPDVLETTLTALYETPKLFEGKTVSVIGMVDTNEDIIRQFGESARVLFRFLISCCAADAQPIALIFQTKSPVRIQGEKVWVRVIGRYSLQKNEGRTIPVIKDAAMSTIPAPANEYLY